MMWLIFTLTFQLCIIGSIAEEKAIILENHRGKEGKAESRATFPKSPTVMTVEGSPSSTFEGSKSRAACPQDYVVTYCEDKSAKEQNKLYRGTFVDPASNGSVCVAENPGFSPRTVALAECSKLEKRQVSDPCNIEGPEVPTFIFRHSKGRSPRVSCPAGYRRTVCNAYSGLTRDLRNTNVNSAGVIPNEYACAMRCSYYCRVTAACMILEDPEEYKNAKCPTVMTVESSPSSTFEGSKSRAACPQDYVVTYCEDKSAKEQNKLYRGTFVDPASNGSVCVAENPGFSPRTVALAECSKLEKRQVSDPCNIEGPEVPTFIYRHSRGRSPRVSCPAGYRRTVCNAHAFMTRDLRNTNVNSAGVIPNEYACAMRCSYYCRVTAACMILEDPEEYKNAKCPTVMTVESSPSSTFEGSKSRAACPQDYVVTYCEDKSAKEQNKLYRGTFVDPASNGSVCVAENPGFSPRTVALAECSKLEKRQVSDPCNIEGPEVPTFIYRHSRGRSPRVSCPAGYRRTVCNAHAFMTRDLRNTNVNSAGVIPNEYACAMRCSYYCRVTAACMILEDPEEYKNAKCPTVMTVA